MENTISPLLLGPADLLQGMGGHGGGHGQQGAVDAGTVLVSNEPELADGSVRVGHTPRPLLHSGAVQAGGSGLVPQDAVAGLEVEGVVAVRGGGTALVRQDGDNFAELLLVLVLEVVEAVLLAEVVVEVVLMLEAVLVLEVVVEVIDVVKVVDLAEVVVTEVVVMEVIDLPEVILTEVGLPEVVTTVVLRCGRSHGSNGEEDNRLHVAGRGVRDALW